jgi:hypothetical protein
MVLMKEEKKEWAYIRNQAKQNKLTAYRVGPANVRFGKGVYAQLGTGTGTRIIDARVRLKAKGRLI